MGSPQFSSAVRAVGEFKTDTSQTQANGAAFDDSGGFPVTVDPTETIQELLFHVVGAEVSVEITTSAGDTFTIPVDGPAVFNRWEIDSIVISDPNGNTPRCEGSWAGES